MLYDVVTSKQKHNASVANMQQLANLLFESYT
jgi:hypothetical protein